MIHSATTPGQIAACHAVFAELRPQYSLEGFVTKVQQLMRTTGFLLVYLESDGIKAVAGYRYSDWLHGGKYLDIDDLVTTANARSQGHGGALFDWLVQEAKLNGCRQVRLVSGVQRADAHRFYERKGMTFEAKYFSMSVV